MTTAPETRPSLLVRLRDPADAPAWKQFVEIYAPLVYGFCRKKGLQDADAADLTQDVLQIVAGAINRLDYDPRRGSFRGWLFTVVRNRVRNFHERQSHRERGHGDTAMLDLLIAQPAPSLEEDRWWDEEHERRLLHWAAEQVRPAVEPATWRAFWGTAVEGRSAKEVAAELGMTVAAVYMARSRVLARLKENVRQVQGEPGDD